MKTNALRFSPWIIDMFGGTNHTVRHYFSRLLNTGIVSTRGEEPMKANELAMLTLARLMGMDRTEKLKEFLLYQEHSPYLSKDGRNFLIVWENIISNGPVGIEKVVFDYSSQFITLTERTPGGTQKVEFTNSQTNKKQVFKKAITVESFGLARLHSEHLSPDRFVAKEILKEYELQ